ncbi:hypothetical protein EZV62_000251 [Acer yangbiense]|uniref:J domain-containing protein n=1 Tax=Acer yangbiense TaxID=1000413 RepID=A0A5C7ITD5_9ROSI|nr:hypothetical protein EZV62_000251 [Acer yangbiense]
MVSLSRMVSVSYLFSDLDVEAAESWLRVFGKEDPEVCIDIAESFFKQENICIDMALYSLGIALFKNPNHPKATNYFKAYITHKIASRTNNNLYAILEITDYRMDIKGIKKAYKFKAKLFHPDKCSSIAAKGATYQTHKYCMASSFGSEKKGRI